MIPSWGDRGPQSADEYDEDDFRCHCGASVYTHGLCPWCIEAGCREPGHVHDDGEDPPRAECCEPICRLTPEAVV